MSAVLDLWLARRQQEGKRDSTGLPAALRLLLHDHLDAPISTVTHSDMARRYEHLAREYVSPTTEKPLAAATHQSALQWTRAVFGWARERGWVRKNPCADVKPIGVKNRRKPQIETLAELHRFRDAVMKRAQAGDTTSLGILIALYLGVRSGEVRSIRARHVDRGGAPRLVVDGTKTENARRAVLVQVPELWALLCQAADRAQSPDERLVDRCASTLWRGVKVIAKAVGLGARAEKITFHSLRGTAASLATQGDVAGRAIADLLGHSSYATTAAHYATPASQEEAQQHTRFRVLAGGRAKTAGVDSDEYPPQADSGAATTQNQAENAARFGPQF
ncbi:MAG: tyrosine-type recombinase/integrase [Pseudomonadota bacterium]